MHEFLFLHFQPIIESLNTAISDPDSYYIKPFLKEHAFSPASVTADLSVEPDSVVEITVTRVVINDR